MQEQVSCSDHLLLAAGPRAGSRGKSGQGQGARPDPARLWRKGLSLHDFRDQARHTKLSAGYGADH